MNTITQKNIRVTVKKFNDDGCETRVSIAVSPTPLWEGDEKISIGENLRGVYFNAKTGNLVVKTFSRWQGNFGENFYLIDENSYDILEYVRNDTELSGIFEKCGKKALLS